MGGAPVWTRATRPQPVAQRRVLHDIAAVPVRARLVTRAFWSLFAAHPAFGVGCGRLAGGWHARTRPALRV